MDANSARICATEEGEASLDVGAPLPFGVPGLNDRVEIVGEGGGCSA